MPLDGPVLVTVVGAGITGLSTSTFLRKYGHAVTMSEQSSLNHEIDAAFQITPNACFLLSPIGIDPHQEGAVPHRASFYLGQHDGRLSSEVPENPNL